MAQTVSMSQCTGAPVRTSNSAAPAQNRGAARIHAQLQPSSAYRTGPSGSVPGRIRAGSPAGTAPPVAGGVFHRLGGVLAPHRRGRAQSREDLEGVDREAEHVVAF